MLRRGLTAGALATLGIVLLTAPAWAGDTIRLIRLPDARHEAPALKLGGDPAADTELLCGKYRGFYGGYRPAFYGYSFSYYRPYYPRFYSYPTFSFGYSYYQPYYYAPPVYYYPRACYYPISLTINSQVGGSVLGTTPAPYGLRPGSEVMPPALPQNGNGGNGTFPYDGGPRSPVPMPKADPGPLSVPLEGRAVSLPAKPTKFAYPAYGEQPGKSSFAEDRATVSKTESTKKASR